jgi:hypothetical protein
MISKMLKVEERKPLWNVRHPHTNLAYNPGCLTLTSGPQSPLNVESEDYANRCDPTTCINECLLMCFLIPEFDNRNELVIF